MILKRHSLKNQNHVSPWRIHICVAKEVKNLKGKDKIRRATEIPPAEDEAKDEKVQTKGIGR